MFRRFMLKKYISFNIGLFSTNLQISSKVNIPKKIYRNELSVLNALASCVQLEAQSQPFCFINEPWLCPNDYSIRKKMILSKASGKLSAKIAFQDIKHDFIQVAQDEPKVKCLLPLLSSTDILDKYKNNLLSAEKALHLIINLFKPQDAWNFYQDNKSQNFSSVVIQNLLELLCATSGVEITFESPPEEIHFTKNFMKKAENPVKWRMDNEAEILFQELRDKCSDSSSSYESMIRGASKFQDPSRALELYQELISKYPFQTPSLGTYNSLLRGLYYWNATDKALQDQITTILIDMSSHVFPNVFTFTNAIWAYSKSSETHFVEQLYQEMLAIGISPVLGTFANALECQFSKAYLVNLVLEVIIHLEENPDKYDRYPIQCEDDLKIFNNCITILRSTSTLDLALRLTSAVLSGRYFHLLANDISWGHYCENFVKLLVHDCTDIAVTMGLIKILVPKYYILQAATVDELISQIISSERYDLVPDLMGVINWNTQRIVEVDAFSKLMNALLSIKLDHQDKALRLVLGNAMEKLFQASRFRKISVLTKSANIELAIYVVWQLNMDDLVWQLIEFSAESNSSLSPMLVLQLLKHLLKSGNQIERVLKLMEFLAGLTKTSPTNEEHMESLCKIVKMADDTILPLLLKLGLNITDFRGHVDLLREHLNVESQASTSSSESDSSSDESSDE